MTSYTTIQIATDIREKLSGLKSGRETYTDLLRKLISLIPEGDDEGVFTNEFKMGLLNARLDVLHGRAISHEDLKKRLGL
jgi:hypothetical protein